MIGDKPLQVKQIGLKALALAAGLLSPLAALAATPLQSTLTLPASTAAYTAGNLIASSATAGSVVVPSFTLPQGPMPWQITRLRLDTNDPTSTAWPAKIVLVDLWKPSALGAAPTFNNGDRAAFSVLVGTAQHLGQFSCTFSAEYSDGAYAECAPAVGSNVSIYAAPGSKIFWTAQAGTGGSGVTGASGVFTLTAEVGK
jgi:hypothetical protein